MSLPWWSSATAVPFPSQTRLITHHCHRQRHSHVRLTKSSPSPSNFTAPRAILLDEIVQLSHNKVLVAAGVSAAIGQLAKPFTSVLFYGREFNFRTAFEAGGFPSTHSSAVVAAATILGVERGLADSIFGITVVYASLIMYDAQGVRREVGKHAKAINTLLQTKTPVNSSFPYKDQDRRVDSQIENRISPLNRNLESGSSLISEEGTKALTVPSLVKEDIASSSLATDVEEGPRTEASHWKPFKESIGHTEIEVAAGALLGFTVFVLRDYAKDILSLRWRSWMTKHYMQRYLKNQSFYKIQSQSIIDNPDQRIVDDLSSFTGTALSFSLALFNSTVDLISFSNILYGIYPPLFVILLLYSIGGTAISVFLGKGLVNLNFLQEKKEADFRYGLVRIRENAESIAFYGGEENEIQLILQRFRSAVENLTKLLIASRNLEFFTNGYRYLIQILPAAVVAPMYFSGKIEFGVINQSVSAFNHILGDFSIIVYQFQAISAFSAIIDRLGEFDDLLDGSAPNVLSNTSEEIHLMYSHMESSPLLESYGSITLDKCRKLLEIEYLTLGAPNGATLVRDLAIIVKEKEHLLVMGPSGCGKTSLLRVLAGLWNVGKGKITFYIKDYPEQLVSQNGVPTEAHTGEDVSEENSRPLNKNYQGIFFLPQRPYMVLGTLRQQLLYPTWAEAVTSGYAEPNVFPSFLMDASNINNVSENPDKPTTDDLIQVLEKVGLGYLLSRFSSLDITCEWSSVLSLGEQQRIAFARLLLSRPKLVLLDESTSALDEANEARLYKQIAAAGITYISVGHRGTLRNHHNSILHISKLSSGNQPNWNIEPILRDDLYELSKQ